MDREFRCDTVSSDKMIISEMDNSDLVLSTCTRGSTCCVRFNKETIKSLIEALNMYLEQDDPEQESSEGITIQEYAGILNEIITTPLDRDWETC